MSTTLRERVITGAALMDEKAPADWYRTVDLDKLNINNTTLCVLGQTFEEQARLSRTCSGYDWAEASFFVKRFETQDGTQTVYHDIDGLAAHGFRAFSDGLVGMDECRDLTEEWRAYILERRAADLVSA